MTDVLVLCDDTWHPAEVIVKGLRDLQSEEFRFDFVMDAKDILTPEYIASFPLIVSCKGNYMTSANNSPWFSDVSEVNARELKEYVSKGGGFLSLHSANTAKLGDEYAEFVGCYFLGHPPRCEISVTMTGSHPIVKGVNNFSIRDEHYQIACTAPDSTALFYTSSATGGNNQAGGYVREIGQGRLCVMTPGHILSVWEHPEYRKLLRNAMNWCLKR